MSHGEILNHIFNDTLGWDDLDAKVYYGYEYNQFTDKEEPGWYIKAPVLREVFLLGDNYEKAIDNLVDFSQDFRITAVKLKYLKDNNPEKFLKGFFGKVDLNLAPERYFPEVKDPELVLVPVGHWKIFFWASLSSIVTAIMMVMLCPGL